MEITVRSCDKILTILAILEPLEFGDGTTGGIIVIRLSLVFALVCVAQNAHAFFFFIPIPNLAKPAALGKIVDALEKSTETRALAYVSEDKTFGSKQWTWGSYSGIVTQEEADRLALEQCEKNLRIQKGQAAGGQPLYDFGNKKCELHAFTPNDGPKIAEERKRAAEESARLAAAEEAKRIADAEEAKQLAADIEAKKLAAEEEARRVLAEDDARRLAVEDEARRSKAGGQKRAKAADSIKLAASIKVDFNAEANKAARILGCQPTELKVIGIDGTNIQYAVPCIDGKMLSLSCDRLGLCLQQNKK